MVGVRVVVVCLIAMAVMFLLIIIAMFVSPALAERELPDAWFVAAAIGFTLASYLFFYWRLAVHMRDVAGGAVSHTPGRSPASV